MDFDANAAYIDGNIVYTATVSTADAYYNASFLVKGSLQADTEKTWTEWQETAITQEDTNIIEDPYEPDDDPNTIGLDQIHEIIVNARPRRRTFHAEYNIDWAYFYAQEGHIYELYAQDLSEYGYFIQLAIFSDPNTILKNENSQDLVANNYLAFSCKESRYYLLRVTLASTYPPEGVEYILGITDPRAEKFTNLLVEVIDPIQEREPGVRCLISGNTSFIGFDKYLQRSPGQHLYRFNEQLVPYTSVLIQVYEGTECIGDPLAETTAWLLKDSLNTVLIDLTGQIPPNIIPRPHDTSYDEEIKVYPQIITNGEYTWDVNNPLPFGDMDPNFLPYRDFDGDNISNLKEALFYRSSPIYPTIVIPLHKGMNLFYLPSVVQVSNIISTDDNDYPVYRYKANSMTWEEPPFLARSSTPARTIACTACSTPTTGGACSSWGWTRAGFIPCPIPWSPPWIPPETPRRRSGTPGSRCAGRWGSRTTVPSSSTPCA